MAYMTERECVGLLIETKVIFMFKQKVAFMKRKSESWPSDGSKGGLYVEAKGGLHEQKGQKIAYG
jgi:hypothetical protein